MNKDVYQINKIIRGIRGYKKKLNSGQLKAVWDAFYDDHRYNFAGYSDYKENTELFDMNKNQVSRLLKVLEVEFFINTLLLIHLVKVRDLQNVTLFFIFFGLINVL